MEWAFENTLVELSALSKAASSGCGSAGSVAASTRGGSSDGITGTGEGASTVSLRRARKGSRTARMPLSSCLRKGPYHNMAMLKRG